MRILLFTGKGGVGKSTLSCATAAAVAAEGEKTLLVSSDLAHNLADILEIPRETQVVSLSQNLSVLEINLLQEINENWESVRRYLADFFSYLGMDDAIAEEVALIPGIDMIFMLIRILREIESNTFDVIVIDCAPTAGTLRLLTLTDTSSHKFNKLLTFERRILKLIRPVGKRFKNFRTLIPEDALYETFGDVIKEIGKLGSIFRDPETTSIRLVLNPDKIALAETKRAYTYFALFGFPVDGIFVNKVFPTELKTGYFRKWYQLQQTQMNLLKKSFLNTPIYQTAYRKTEPIGLDKLEDLGREIYGTTSPSSLLSQIKTVEFKKHHAKTILIFHLPHLEKKNLDIGQKGQELLIQAGDYSRVFSLPDSLGTAEIEQASYEENQLEITFAQK